MHFYTSIAVCLTLLTAPLLAQEAPVEREKLAAPADAALPPFAARGAVSGQLVSIGADTMDELMKAWISGFQSREPNVQIELKSQASMNVPASFAAGVSQMMPLSREMNPAEVEAFRTRHGYAPTEVAVALGSYRTPTRTVALTFYVNDANPTKRIDLRQLDAMWCTTLRRGAPEAITEWGQLGATGEWAHRPVHLVGVQPPDGVPNFITRRVCDGGLLRGGILGEKNGGATSVLTRIVKDVAADEDAIGYAGFHNQLPGTHPVDIGETSAGPFYQGTFQEVRTARYPLTRFIYIYIDRAPNAPLQPALREFLTYVLSLDGQRIVEQQRVFMPLPASIAALQRAKLRSDAPKDEIK
jgi:phosphate transport system substrate-binding protein